MNHFRVLTDNGTCGIFTVGIKLGGGAGPWGVIVKEHYSYLNCLWYNENLIDTVMWRERQSSETKSNIKHLRGIFSTVH